MAKIRTIQHLQDALDKEWSWRIFELSYLRKSLSTSSDKIQAPLIRASIAMLYAHWEGFIKQSASYYLEYVNRKGLCATDVSDPFLYLWLKKIVGEMAESKNPSFGLSAFKKIKLGISSTESISFGTSVDTGSNLNSVRFSGILISIGIDIDRYRAYFNLIDELLLGRRNSIAHGQFLNVDVDSFQETFDKTLMMMRWFKTDIENAASLEAFRSSSVA